MTNALIIAGHGSHLSPHTAAPAWQHADAIRAMGVFDEITCAFWKESPPLHRVIDTLTADDVTIVPLFTSQGYFSRTVLPNELGLEGPLTRRSGRTIRYTETVGQHPHMASVVRDRAESVITRYNLDTTQTAVALAGHGTRRDRASAAATQHQAETLRATGRFAEVVAVYMDEPPEIETVYAITRSPSIIVVPFFVADGSHTQEDIPVDLRLARDPRHEGYTIPSKVEGRDVYYTSAVGMEPSVANVILDLARDAGTELHERCPNDDPWAGFPRAGLDALRAMRFPFQYGQVMVEQSGETFSVHNVNNLHAVQNLDALENPAVLRERLSRDTNGNFRALRTASDLPDGWRVTVKDHQALLAVLETTYPAAWIDSVQQRTGQLSVHSVNEVVSRQTGMYKRVGNLSVDLLPVLVEAQCGACVRAPLWFDSSLANSQDSKVVLPCPEPCQCWMSLALQQSDSRREGLSPVEFSPAEIASLRAALEIAIAHPDPDVRPAEYDDPRNPARLRALLARLPASDNPRQTTGE